MTVTTTTHLNFRGEAREALGFYQSVFGGDLVAISYADAGAAPGAPESDQIMWGQVAAGNGFRVMAYDVPAALEHDAGIIPIFVSVRGNDAAELTAFWDRLSKGGRVVQPLSPSGWSPLYGMVRDRFGVTWVLDIEYQRP